MEGVKILSEEMIRNFGGETLFPFLIFLGILILIFGICLISYYGFVEVESLIEILVEELCQSYPSTYGSPDFPSHTIKPKNTDLRGKKLCDTMYPLDSNSFF